MTTQNAQKMDLTGTGWSESDAIEAALEARIEQHRYADETDRVLARHEEVDTLFPSFEELKALGINVEKFADALDNGLDAKLFGVVLEQGLGIEGFNQTLEAGIDISTFNAGMGVVFTMKALIVVIMGGVGNVLGGFLAALLLGLAESFGAWLIDPGLTLAINFAMFILVLLLRPKGLLGGR